VLLQDVARFVPEDSPWRRLRKLEADLRPMGLTPEDAHLVGQLLALPVPEDSPALQLTPERRKERTFDALSRIVLHRAGHEAPVLLVVEDLHWAGSFRLEFLGLLLERIEKARLLVVLSARPELQPDWPRCSWFHRLVLERLPAGLAATLAREVARGQVLQEETIQRLVSRTDGIPLFIEEMTRMVLESGEAASIPVTLHELLLARLDMLPSQVYVALACYRRRDVPEILTLTEQAMALSSERGFKVWLLLAARLRGWALSELGQPREGLVLFQRNLERWRVTGWRIGLPFNSSLLADIHLRLGQVQEALAAVEEGLVQSATTGEHHAEALLHRLRGECLRCLGREDEARQCFLRAIAVAHEQGAGLFELRATVSLCRHLRDLGRTRVARRLLSRAHARAAPGGDCVDLGEARTLLDELSRGARR
jgi:tetratricopeptide (TPR) repeat protein